MKTYSILIAALATMAMTACSPQSHKDLLNGNGGSGTEQEQSAEIEKAKAEAASIQEDTELAAEEKQTTLNEAYKARITKVKAKLKDSTVKMSVKYKYFTHNWTVDLSESDVDTEGFASMERTDRKPRGNFAQVKLNDDGSLTFKLKTENFEEKCEAGKRRNCPEVLESTQSVQITMTPDDEGKFATITGNALEDTIEVSIP